jgi:hypothetical protein
MLADINALEQFPGEIARGRGAKEIGDHQSNRARYPGKHGFNFDVLDFQAARSFIARLSLTAIGQKRSSQP